MTAPYILTNLRFYLYHNVNLVTSDLNKRNKYDINN
jgi:hypothetical protein